MSRGEQAAPAEQHHYYHLISGETVRPSKRFVWLDSGFLPGSGSENWTVRRYDGVDSENNHYEQLRTN